MLYILGRVQQSEVVTMNTATNYFQISDPNLPFLAANAAIEIDDIIKGRSNDLKNARLLVEKIIGSDEGLDADYGSRSFIDPVASNVISKAFFVSHGASINSHKEYSKALKKIAEELESLLDAGHKPEEGIRKFFVALSQQSLAYQGSFFDIRNTPYKR